MKIVVDAKAWSRIPDIKELFAHRDLFLTLAYRDIRVRYAQTMLGVIWALFQPLATMLILILVFDRALKVDTAGVPYPVFAITGISAWSYFSFVLRESGSSIIGAQEIVRKIYFPRLIIPLSKATVGLVDLAVSLMVMISLYLYHDVPMHWGMAIALLYLVGIMITAVGVGIWVSALTIRFRDIQHLVPFLIQFGLFVTPVAYPAQTMIGSIPRWAQVLYFLNPMAGMIEGYRWALLGVGAPGGMGLISLASSLVICISGLFYFRSMERKIADLV